MFLRQSTSQIIRFGPFLDSTDGVTPETALTIAQADMQLSKDGAAYAQKSAAGNATHDTDGWYSTTLSTTDADTVGELYMQVNVTGALPVWIRYWVLEEAIYDDLYGASAVGYLKPTVASRTLDITATGAAGVDWANVEGQSTSVNLSSTTTNLVNTTTTNTDMRGTDGANTVTPDAAGVAPTAVENRQEMDSNSVDLNSILTNQSAISGQITALNDFDPGSDAAANVTLCATTTTNTDMVGTDNALLAADINLTGGAVDNVTLVATTTTNTDMRGTDSAATAAALATVDGNVDAILVDTGTTLPAQITALNDISVSDILTTQMTEAYAADGVAPTLAQALFLIQQTIGDFSISGTTITTKEIDGSTTAATYTLDDGTSPTSRTRTT